MEIDEKDLPFRAEYAKSGRAKCKACKDTISNGSLRLAVMTQSPFHDGKVPNWHHENCFFRKQRPGSEGDIANFVSLRTADQQKIRDKIAKNGGPDSAVLPAAKGKKRSKNSISSNACKDFGVEYAKSGRATCAGCELKILKDAVRIKKTVYDTEVGQKFGGQPIWHHVECFTQCRNDLAYFASGRDLPGFKQLSKEDQDLVSKAVPSCNIEDIPEAKKLKLEVKDEVDNAEDAALDKKIEKQNKLLFKYRDLATKIISKKDVIAILEHNNQFPKAGDTDKLFAQFGDLLAFGALKRCKICNEGQFHFNRSGYLCNGNLTDWTKCAQLVKEPEKTICKIPDDLREKYDALANYKGKVEVRAFKYVPPSSITLAKMVKKEESSGPRVKRERPPLYNLTLAIVGLKEEENDLKKKIQQLGGKVSSKIDEKTIAIISNEDQVNKKSSKMKTAQTLGIHVVPVDFIEAVKNDPTGAISYITSKSICDWGTDPSTRIPPDEEKPSSSKSKSIYTKSVPKSMKLTLKGGLAVEPDSGLTDLAHVYKDKSGNIYNAVLGLTDIQKGKNSYYKLQVLESDAGNRYHVFRSWGRIGTTIGGKKLENFDTLPEAIESFKFQYADKTGNDFDNRKFFVKVPGRMYPIEVEYSNDNDNVKLNVEHKIKSKLPVQVQDLIKLIFDVDAMKKVMMEFDLDMDKMPLGKLSQKQIQNAYKVLSELTELIQKDTATNSQFIDATNRFYTLIPHDFGIDNPPILDTSEKIKHHSEVLDNLMEIECAYSMLKDEDGDSDKNPIDQHFEQLKTELIPLEKSSEEYKLMQKYVENTHAETHRSFNLEILDIFKVSRKNEARRYKPFKKLHNRKLLWHGSRLTNYAGILSHGLKIAPPEAPSTGYMFGKGIYFADMVSKSGNYCCTSKQNSIGLMLVSEVALGNMLECDKAKYVTTLPKDKHSTKGIGQTYPNPKESHFTDGVEVPFGKAIQDAKVKSSLLYNEYIVYDVAQVNIKYLFKMKFNYNY